MVARTSVASARLSSSITFSVFRASARMCVCLLLTNQLLTDLHTGQQSEQRPQGVSPDDVHEKQFPAPETAPGFKGDRDQAAPDMLK